MDARLGRRHRRSRGSWFSNAVFLCETMMRRRPNATSQRDANVATPLLFLPFLSGAHLCWTDSKNEKRALTWT